MVGPDARDRARAAVEGDAGGHRADVLVEEGHAGERAVRVVVERRCEGQRGEAVDARVGRVEGFARRRLDLVGRDFAAGDQRTQPGRVVLGVLIDMHPAEHPVPRAHRRRALTLYRTLDAAFAAADVELAIGAAEVHLDRLGREEQPLRDLAVGRSPGGEVGDAALGRRQLAARGGPRPAADEPELVAGALRQRGGAARVGGVEPLAQRRPRGPAFARGALAGAEFDERASAFERRRLEVLDGLLEQRDRRFTRRGQSA